MAQKKKLQVFISSTYTDLKEERQAAVEAVLTAGHIPAGMELFAAGDESQMNVIKRWIDESDVYLLLLGGRYGSIEPATQKSYIHLEYEYAVSTGKPVFAVVVEEAWQEQRVKQLGSKVIETDEPHKFREFKAHVLTKMVKFWSDPRDIKLAILETMAEFSLRPELVGWIPGDEAVNGGALAEEIARLTKENASLREQTKSAMLPSKYNGLTFEEMYSVLSNAKPKCSWAEERKDDLMKIATAMGDTEPSIFHLFWMVSIVFQQIPLSFYESDRLSLAHELEGFALVGCTDKEGRYYTYKLTEHARQFLLRFRLERDVSKLDELRLPSF